MTELANRHLPVDANLTDANRRATVLVVDDDPDIARLLSIILEMGGFKVYVIVNSADVTERIFSINPDLVLLDINMPGMDGWALLPKVRALSAAPVVIFSAANDSRNSQRSIELGAAAYIRKPVSPPELIAQLKAIMAGKTPLSRWRR